MINPNLRSLMRIICVCDVNETFGKHLNKKDESDLMKFHVLQLLPLLYT